ncbi:VOC family protein [Gordonia sp. NB41Y]|uniref:VOC family protein n=1 Tax=Gordonia sp. NB41Y TaxID=875808 RepID=UPI0006B1926D|nr:VOC family protein [Gordonia sp. NB41Y]EMP14292.2 glyoxalase [Gordonia sp. NB41Y]WLP90790.1 VOC family protein [Gordonia sp. NB41Y]
MAVSLSFVTVLARDLGALADFYQDVFSLDDVSELNGQHFRGLRIGDTTLGFGGESSIEMLNLPPSDLTDTPMMFWTFEADTAAEVDALTERAVAAGAQCIKAPGETYYGSWQAVLLDPEGNAFRINHTM